jgi:hypothetical protein
MSLLASREEGWLPLRGVHPDYNTNHRRLAEFWGITMTKRVQLQDINHRWRLAARLLHPDKQTGKSPTVQGWVAELYMALDASYTEILWRMESIKKGELPSAVTEAQTPFQEVPESFGVFLIARYKPDLFISGTSESTWWCIGRVDDQPIHPSLSSSIEFMELLLHSHDDIGLLELLEGVSLKPVVWTEKKPFKTVLVLQRIPHSFTKWLEHQLGELRAKGVFLDLTIIMFADAYPTSWLKGLVALLD